MQLPQLIRAPRVVAPPMSDPSTAPKKISLLDYKKKREDLAATKDAATTENTLEAKLATFLKDGSLQIDRLREGFVPLLKGESSDGGKISILSFMLNNQLLQVESFADDAVFRGHLYNWFKAVLCKYEEEIVVNVSVCNLLLHCLREMKFTAEQLQQTKFLKVSNRLGELLERDKSAEVSQLGTRSSALHSDWLRVLNGKGEPSAKRQKRRVTFAPDDQLVKIKYFTPVYGTNFHRGRDSYAESEKSEATFAFQKSSLLEPQIPWTTPPRLIRIPAELVRATDPTAESKVQEDRERRVLSISYLSPQQIPDSPAEPLDLASTTLIPDAIIPSIPLIEISSGFPASVPALDTKALTKLLNLPELSKILCKK